MSSDYTQTSAYAFDDTDPLAKISPTYYSSDEVIAIFQRLYDVLDFKRELAELGLGRFQLGKRKKALRELRAITITCWKFALEQSFPEKAEEFFEAYLTSAPQLNTGKKEAALLNECITAYVELLSQKKTNDFSPVADRLIEELGLKSQEDKRLRLKLTLITRSLYSTVFKNLV